MAKDKYDFSGWATRNGLKCSDGRTILKDAFKHCDGKTVPLVWNHQHREPFNVLGHALLENREEGVYARATFNDTEAGQNAKLLVEHGDVSALSILAHHIKEQGRNVIHGAICEVSLVLAGANPGAFIDSIVAHADGEDEEAIIYTGENIVLAHADEDNAADDEETIADVINSMTDKQKSVAYYMAGQALESKEAPEEHDSDIEHSDIKNPKGGSEIMKHNVFDKEDTQDKAVLKHSDEQAILNLAKSNSVGTLRAAISIYAEKNETLAHGIDEIETLFPEYKDVRPGAPELIQRDQGWVGTVMQKVHKSPISRIRTRQADVRGTNLRAKGYKKGNEKTVSENISLLKRTTDPQSVYRKDALHRDDIIDITDFDVVEFQYGVMRQNLNEDLALAIMVGDGRDIGDDDKISEDHIRSIWHDNDLYTIHTDVDINAARAELQGTNTGANFGENYIYSEAIITAALYSREKYKGSGTPDFYCTPHLLNVMLLARDLNGRRIYHSKAELIAALNVGEIYTAEQFEGLVRTTTDNQEKKLLGIFVTRADYQVGATKGGEITRFHQFDIDFNNEKYLIETRMSGALTRVYSAIALEEDISSAG
jgi:HK97 family phage prohead protease